jgi:hypothetical protein
MRVQCRLSWDRNGRSLVFASGRRHAAAWRSWKRTNSDEWRDLPLIGSALCGVILRSKAPKLTSHLASSLRLVSSPICPLYRMEGIAAFGLAANILQMVEMANKLLSTGQEIYQAGTTDPGSHEGRSDFYARRNPSVA